MTIDGNHIIADEGKVFRRKGTDEVFGDELFLGLSFYIGGVRQDPPHEDVPTDFEEIDSPVEDAPADDAQHPEPPVIPHATVEWIVDDVFRITADDGYILYDTDSGQTESEATASGDIASRFYAIALDAEELEAAKERKLADLERYANSDAVKSFSLFGKQMWLGPAVRENYLISLQSAERLGYEAVPFMGREIPISTAIEMLDRANVYGMESTSVTEAHKAAILALDSVQAVAEYDYTIGYPLKLVF